MAIVNLRQVYRPRHVDRSMSIPYLGTLMCVESESLTFQMNLNSVHSVCAHIDLTSALQCSYIYHMGQLKANKAKTALQRIASRVTVVHLNSSKNESTETILGSKKKYLHV